MFIADYLWLSLLFLIHALSLSLSLSISVGVLYRVKFCQNDSGSVELIEGASTVSCFFWPDFLPEFLLNIFFAFLSIFH